MRTKPNLRRLPLLFAAILMSLASIASAQKIDCLPEKQELPTIPELAAAKGSNKLRGTIVVSVEQLRFTFRTPPSAPTPGSKTDCYPQWVRTFRGIDAKPPLPPMAAGSSYNDPMPGPTLRARVGDLIQLTLLNQIDVGKFPYSVDRGENQKGCDQSANYPAIPNNPGAPVIDQFPDCFHGSSTANIHFHGTHTNPGSTGDNVFIEVRPSPRKADTNEPTVTAASVKAPFDEFFANCEAQLSINNPLRQWPYTWSDLPANWTNTQKQLLEAYDNKLPPGGMKLWPVDKAQIAKGAWPQYYIGAVPYCFRIPKYPANTPWPPPAPAPASTSASATPAPSSTAASATHAAHKPEAGTAGAGTAEIPGEEPLAPLQMGQSPGTHWYHAHKHGSTAINVANGMTGAFILEGQYDDDLNKYYGTDWTSKAKVMVINQLGVTPNLVRGGPGGLNRGQDKGADFSVNGRLRPNVTMKPGEVQMWRIANTTGRAGVMFLQPNVPPAPVPPQTATTGPAPQPAPAPGTPALTWKQLAQDGVQFNPSNYGNNENEQFLLMSGNRADLLVKAPTTPGSYPVYVKNIVDLNDLESVPGQQTGAAALTLLTVVVEKGPTVTGKPATFVPQADAPAFPPFLADIKDSEITGTKKIVFASTNPPATHTIDGKQFDGEVGVAVLLNTVEEWTISNETTNAISHPFHIHINPFQVTEVFSPNAPLLDANGNVVYDSNGNPISQYTNESPAPYASQGQCSIDLADPKTWKPCGPPPAGSPIWWDVFPIPSAGSFTVGPGSAAQTIVVPGYFKMRSRFVDYHGYYVIHCHILAHEDRGMMTVVNVTPYRSPYSHH